MNKLLLKRLSLLVLLPSLFLSGLLQANQNLDQTETTENTLNLSLVISKINQLMKAHHYNPEALTLPDYLATKQKVEQLTQSKLSKSEFIHAFNAIWQQGPFSHVRLDHAHQSASQLANYLDTMNVGEQAYSLTWQQGAAILTINTMMGNDTIAFINKAYSTLVTQQASALIIDLRNNTGGAFAVKPLVGHLLTSPLDVGGFVSQQWFNANASSPKQADMLKPAAWQGWSIKSFWQDVQAAPLTRVQFQPMLPIFKGPVYVLTSKKTASAAELAVDALVNLPNVTVIGEPTAGEMLSQIMFDLPESLQLYLPIADYYSVHSGRIEGVGIKPNIETQANSAFNKALELAKVNTVRINSDSTN
ncbi:S41 family peptidase [Algibacillus agarilyticus]|uniref:S41 family peptidase n=1 Tax=Algibacillus agarilyticus TaxID=2234133 RepID=UPI000DD0D6CA|nr:S41 family peptidase [Algibacillus agarilyticus]